MKRSTTLAALGAAVVLTTTARADLVVDLGGGWEAVIFEPNLVGLAVDFVSIENDILVIEKFADFFGVDPITGQPVPARIAFTQTGSDAETVSRIVITDELLANHTGSAWTGFQMSLLGSSATFDAAASADFSIDPFSSMTFSDDASTAFFSGGSVADGDFWTPGAVSGGLWIDVDLSGTAPVTFILKEIAVIPAPAATAVLAFAATLVGRRRRR